MPAVHPTARRSCSRRWPVTCSATRRRSPSTRQARPLREARAAIESRGRADRADGRRSARSARSPTLEAVAPRVLRRAARRRATTATSRPAPRCGSLAAPLRHRRRCRSTPTRSSTARSARRACVVEDLTAALDARHRGAHPAGRRHQAPGQDGHGRHLPLRRDAAAGRRWCSEVLAAGAAARPAQLPDAAHAGRPRPGGRGGHRLHPLPHRGRRRAPTTPPSTSSTGAASPATSPSRTERDPGLRGTKHRVAIEREVTVAPRPPATAAP